VASEQEIIAELRTLGATDQEIQEALGQPLQHAQPAARSETDIMAELQELGVTDQELLQQGISTAPTEEEQVQQLRQFQEVGQLRKQARAEGARLAAEEATPLQAGLASAGRSFAKAERVISGATGLRPEEDIKEEREQERERFAALQEAKPVSTFVGGVAGDVAVGLPLGGPVGALTKKATGKFLGPKLSAIGGAAAAGAIEETLVEGNPLLGLAFGASGEVLLPLAGNAIRDTYKKFTGNANPDIGPDGKLTPQAVQELEDAGFTLDELGADAERILIEKVNPEQSLAAQARQAEAAVFDSRQTSSKASQDAELQALEADALAERGKIAQAAENILSKNQQDLVRGAEKRLLEPLGSSQTVFNIQDIANRGNKTEAGNLLRDYLKRNKNIAKEDVSKLYNIAKNLPGSDAPVSGAEISQTLIQSADSATDELQNKVLKALAKFKVVGDDAVDLGAGNFRTTVGETNINFRSAQAPQNLSVGNAEELRKMLNSFPVQSNADTALLTQLKSSLDRATADAVENMPESSVKRTAFEIARASSRRLKEAYEDNDVIEKLLTFKDFKGQIPQVPSDQIIEQFVKGGRALQNSKRLKGMLLTNPEGKQIWNDIRGSVGEDLLKNSLKKNTRNEWVLNFNNLDRQLKNIGTEKLKIFFNPNEIKELNRLKRVLKVGDTPLARVSSTSGSGEVASNTAFRIIDSLARMSLGNRLGGVTDIAGSAVGRSKASILRQKDLQEGLASIEGRRLSKRERELSKGAKIQQYLQSLSIELDRATRGQVGASVGTEIQERLQ
tara:strand:- start:1809 stop:4175 length:2367 start_codon:yes stop_codon:yes gene_type:complete